MKIIITGCTGLVGSALLRQCVASEAVSHVFVLARRPLPDHVAESPKVSVILHHDFSTYPPALLDQLAGAEGCLWWVSAPFFLDCVPADGTRLLVGGCMADGPAGPSAGGRRSSPT
jgi:hypothetical protein